VCLPGELACGGAKLRDGIELYPSIMPALEPWTEKFSVAMPKALP
jgi:hypothetical protein